MAHIVRNAWSRRCSHSIHGHSYTAEIMIESKEFDSGGMVMDFGLVKKYIHPFIDSFDHATMLWNQDDPEIISLFENKFERVIVSPFTSSCEQQARYFYWIINEIIEYVKVIDPQVSNRYVSVRGVRIHETKTGSAFYTSHNAKSEDNKFKYTDVYNDIVSIKFSDGIISEWPKEIQHIYHDIFDIDPQKLGN
jgi:6-pyruvoyltetrahydropterin/6-carboxytetrahydropterin synthase